MITSWTWLHVLPLCRCGCFTLGDSCEVTTTDSLEAGYKMQGLNWNERPSSSSYAGSGATCMLVKLDLLGKAFRCIHHIHVLES